METPSQQSLETPPTFFARDVALAFAEETAADTEEERSAIILVAMDIGQSLADCGHPGRWDLFSPAHLFDRISFLSDSERVGVAMRTLGMFQYLALVELLSVESAIQIGEEILAAAPQAAVLSQLHKSFLSCADEMAEELPN